MTTTITTTRPCPTCREPVRSRYLGAQCRACSDRDDLADDLAADDLADDLLHDQRELREQLAAVTHQLLQLPEEVRAGAHKRANLSDHEPSCARRPYAPCTCSDR